jgi:CRP/FNR family transcriptional regulator, dissimilatory nitrate respiration regulator
MVTPSPDEILEALSRPPLFRGLPEEDLLALRGIGLPRSFEKGELIFRQGEPSRGFYLVIGGVVKLYKLSLAGKEQILHVNGPGQPFAEAALGVGARYPANAEATEAATVLLFPREEFTRLIGRRPDLAANLIARLSQRVREMAALVEDLSLREAPSRLARHLLDLPGKKTADGISIELPMKKGELASLIGTRGETFSRILRKMSDAGIITVTGTRVLIRDPLKLESLAAGESLAP